MIILQIRHTTLVVIRVSGVRSPVALLIRATSPNILKNSLNTLEPGEVGICTSAL